MHADRTPSSGGHATPEFVTLELSAREIDALRHVMGAYAATLDEIATEDEAAGRELEDAARDRVKAATIRAEVIPAIAAGTVTYAADALYALLAEGQYESGEDTAEAWGIVEGAASVLRRLAGGE